MIFEDWFWLRYYTGRFVDDPDKAYVRRLPEYTTAQDAWDAALASMREPQSDTCRAEKKHPKSLLMNRESQSIPAYCLGCVLDAKMAELAAAKHHIAVLEKVREAANNLCHVEWEMWLRMSEADKKDVLHSLCTDTPGMELCEALAAAEALLKKP